MPIAPQTLDALARTYAAGMTSIRGRRVHRLILRAFADCDTVRVLAAEGGSTLFGVSPGRAVILRTDGRGKAAVVRTWADGATQIAAHDLLKDSLPVVDQATRPETFAVFAQGLDLPGGLHP